MRTITPETGVACTDGRVTGAQAAMIARAVGELPAGPVRAEAERTLLEHAATYDPVVLGRLGRRIAAHVDPDADAGAEAGAWGCVRLLADVVSILPLDVYRTGSRDPVEPPTVLVRPAAGMDVGEWLWCLMFDALTSPAAWCLITYRAGASLRPAQLEPLGRGRVSVTTEQDGTRLRVVHRLDGREIDPDQLWRFRLYPTAGTPAGLDPIGYAAETIGQALAAQRYGAAYFRDAAVPSTVLASDQIVTPAQAEATAALWEHAHKGRRGTAVLGNGLKPLPLIVTPEQSQFLEAQRFFLQQTCRYFGVPPEMIGADSGNPKTYANLEQRNLDFLTFGVGRLELQAELAGRVQVYQDRLVVPARGASFQALPAVPKRLGSPWPRASGTRR